MKVKVDSMGIHVLFDGNDPPGLEAVTIGADNVIVVQEREPSRKKRIDAINSLVITLFKSPSARKKYLIKID